MKKHELKNRKHHVDKEAQPALTAAENSSSADASDDAASEASSGHITVRGYRHGEHPAHSDAELMRRIVKAQKYTVVSQAAFQYMADRVAGDQNRKILQRMADEETEHLAYLEGISGKSVGNQAAKIRRFKAESRILGVTFTSRKLHGHKQFTNDVYAQLKELDPTAEQVYQRSLNHENELIGFIDEERLHYVGAMVLGLNDALVEITGALAGVTFSLCNTKVVALTGIVTGISATLSMAASNYLAVKADGSNDAMKSGLITGGAYLAAVVLLVLPYLLLPDNMYAPAFWIMLGEVIIILVAFNYYLAVANRTPFWKRFLQMAVVSMGVALIAFLIGLAAKDLLGITVA